jgi:hypothetical protein
MILYNISINIHQLVYHKNHNSDSLFNKTSRINYSWRKKKSRINYSPTFTHTRCVQWTNGTLSSKSKITRSQRLREEKNKQSRTKISFSFDFEGCLVAL